MPDSERGRVEASLTDEWACPKCMIPVNVKQNDIDAGIMPFCPRCKCADPKTKPLVKTQNKIPVPLMSKRNEFKTNPLKRLIGYEIEAGRYIDGDAITAVAKKYGAGLGRDGSVPDGFEMTTPPANGDVLVEMLQDISETLIAAGTKATEAAGLHTHVDCRDLSYNCMRKVCVLYGKTEGAIYSLIDPRRVFGTYCKPVGGDGLVEMMADPSKAKENIINLVYGSKKNVTKSGRRSKEPAGGDRYLGLNLHSWWMRGTIEFRMHHGTVQWEKMLMWGMMLAAMVQTATDSGDREIAEWPEGLEGILKWCPTKEVADWCVKRYEYFSSKAKGGAVPFLYKDKPANKIEIVSA